ncbi:MAG: metal-dependent hydrolase [Vicinamibacterales bacterium]
MDNLTHSLCALTLAQTPLKRAGRGTTLTLLLASNAPDSDVVVGLARGGEAYLSAHRGSSHGPLGILTLAVVVATLIYVARRRGRPPTPFFKLVGIALVGTLGHVLMDLPTSYGTRLFSPFDSTWYAVDLMPIIDVYLLGLLAIGLIAGRMTVAFGGHVAVAVLVLMGVNYAFRTVLHTMALGRAGGNRTDVVSSWPDAPRPKLPNDYSCPAEPCTLEIAAIPTFVSPFSWRIIRQLPNGYDIREMDLLAGVERPIAWLPNDSAPAVDAARQGPATRSFLAFSRFPTARVRTHDDETVVRIFDVRFLDAPLSEGEEELRGGGLFGVRVRIDRHGRILDDRLGN